jgi:hypothetical protein
MVLSSYSDNASARNSAPPIQTSSNKHQKRPAEEDNAGPNKKAKTEAQSSLATSSCSVAVSSNSSIFARLLPAGPAGLPVNFYDVIKPLFDHFWEKKIDNKEVAKAFFANINSTNCKDYGLKDFSSQSYSFSIIKVSYSSSSLVVLVLPTSTQLRGNYNIVNILRWKTYFMTFRCCLVMLSNIIRSTTKLIKWLFNYKKSLKKNGNKHIPHFDGILASDNITFDLSH